MFSPSFRFWPRILLSSLLKKKTNVLKLPWIFAGFVLLLERFLKKLGITIAFRKSDLDELLRN
jgi:hypothetical protein